MILHLANFMQTFSLERVLFRSLHWSLHYFKKRSKAGHFLFSCQLSHLSPRTGQATRATGWDNASASRSATRSGSSEIGVLYGFLTGFYRSLGILRCFFLGMCFFLIVCFRFTSFSGSFRGWQVKALAGL